MEEKQLLTDNEIKKALRVFTDDFGSEEIDFIKNLVFPMTVFVYNLSLSEEDPEQVCSFETESLSDLLALFKKNLPTNSLVMIPTEIGTMELYSRI